MDEPAPKAMLARDDLQYRLLDYHGSLAPRSLWAWADSPEKDDKGHTNPVANTYYSLWALGIGRWICSVIVMVLAGCVFARGPSKPLFAVSIAQAVVSGVHILLPAPYVRARSPTDARAPRWYPLFVVTSMVMWAAVMAVTIVFFTDDNISMTMSVYKRARFSYYGGAFRSAEKTTRKLIIGLICSDAAALTCNLCKLFVWLHLRFAKFDNDDIMEAYVLGSKKVTREDAITLNAE